MAVSRKVYTPEFQVRAVRMITDQKPSVAEVARRLGAPENRLHDGKKAVLRKGADAFPGAGHLNPGRGGAAPPPGRGPAPGDLERDILKHATAFLATQSK